jgi:hypothetical protein|tara:strand:+ start:340 stop:525 length:186 start_codon:yes stop_codon:yes gene_type:complete
MTKQDSKFGKGQKVNYYGNTAIVRSVKFNVFSKDFDYSIGYKENGLRKGQTGVNEYELKTK